MADDVGTTQASSSGTAARTEETIDPWASQPCEVHGRRTVTLVTVPAAAFSRQINLTQGYVVTTVVPTLQLAIRNGWIAECTTHRPTSCPNTSDSNPSESRCSAIRRSAEAQQVRFEMPSSLGLRDAATFYRAMRERGQAEARGAAQEGGRVYVPDDEAQGSRDERTVIPDDNVRQEGGNE